MLLKQFIVRSSLKIFHSFLFPMKFGFEFRYLKDSERFSLTQFINKNTQTNISFHHRDQFDLL